MPVGNSGSGGGMVADKERIVSELKSYESEVTTLVKEIGDEFTIYGNPNATTQLDASAKALIANVDEVFNIMMTTGDGRVASEILTGDYMTNMEGVKAGMTTLDASVDALRGNVVNYMAQSKSKITVMNVTGMVVFIVCLLLNLYVSFVLITKVIVKISVCITAAKFRYEKRQSFVCSIRKLIS